MEFDLRTICRSLAANHFSIDKELLNTLENMYESSDNLKRDYSTIRRIFKDKKLSWKEIDQLNQFLTITIPNSWNDDWSEFESVIKSLQSNKFNFFERIQYIREINYRAFPDGHESEKLFHYFLNGQK